jgi:hypothetical protein
MPSHALHIVRYEDMAREPLRAFGDVAGFLGMRAGPERIARAVERSAFPVLQRQEARHGFRERSKKSDRFFRAGEVGQGRRLLNRDLIAALGAAHRESMERFGYWPGSAQG